MKNIFLSERLDEAKESEAKWLELRRMQVCGNRTSSLSYFSADVLNKHFAAIVNRFASLAEEDFQNACDYIVSRVIAILSQRNS